MENPKGTRPFTARRSDGVNWANRTIPGLTRQASAETRADVQEELAGELYNRFRSGRAVVLFANKIRREEGVGEPR